LAETCSCRGATESKQGGRTQANGKDGAYPGHDQAGHRAAQGQAGASPDSTAYQSTDCFTHTIALGVSRGKAAHLGSARFTR
jgi:hypothetical protein